MDEINIKGLAVEQIYKAFGLYGNVITAVDMCSLSATARPIYYINHRQDALILAT